MQTNASGDNGRFGQEPTNTQKLTKKEFETPTDVRWCPGCGDYSILAQTQRILPDLGVPREKFVFVSGIGCSSRFPYYMNTYGFHSIHGRAPTIAAGVKAANPDLSVWVITGDGDALSIGGNHFIHLLRRNLDINVILFNNRIYGLTKGQYSPTSEHGKVTKSSPMGVIEHPINPISLALASSATFVARGLDRDPPHLQAIIRAAYEHKGTSFIEVYQNCNVFNDGAHSRFTEKDSKADNVVILEHGKPLIFGKDNDKGICLKGTNTEVVSLTDGKWKEEDLLVHDQYSLDRSHAYFLSRMSDSPDLPQPFGVFRSVDYPCYEYQLEEQVRAAKEQYGAGNLESLLASGDTWVVE